MIIYPFHHSTLSKKEILFLGNFALMSMNTQVI